MAANPYAVGPFYKNMDDVKDSVFGALSLTSQFKVSLLLKSSSDDLKNHLTKCGLLDDADLVKYDFMCAEATLPGSTFDMAEEYGSRQGVIERFPTRRIYSDFNLTFYVDRDYKLIRLFEEWMNFIDPLYAKNGDKIIKYDGSPYGQSNNDYMDSNAFYRFKYPDTYKKLIAITKFERDYVNPKGNPQDPTSMTYHFVDAFPTNLTALPLSYAGSTVTKTTINFSYSRYVVMKHQGTIENVTVTQNPAQLTNRATSPSDEGNI